MSARRYLRLWLVLAGVLVLLVAGVNLVVDPYGLFRLLDAPGFNTLKPNAGAHGATVKAYQVLRVRPRGLILGNSRAEVGLDPEHPAWPIGVRPVFNLALPGTGTATTLRYLQHALADSGGVEQGKPTVVVWGIDFMDFLVDAGEPVRSRPRGREGGRLLVNPDGSHNPGRILQQVRDYGEASLTLGAFFDSVQTVRSQGNPYSADLTPLGFNPMRDYLRITGDEGYWAVFRQRDMENIKAYLQRPKDIFDARGRSSPALDDLRQVLRMCREQGIALQLVIYPYHAHLLETIRITGHWQAFEAWKRAVVQVVAEDARVAGTPVPLWDFSGFNALTSEAVPNKGDRRAKMRWYWEAGHFKRELGDLILERLFAHPGESTAFGILLGMDNIEAQIMAVREQGMAYRRAHLQEVAELEHIASQMRQRMGQQ